MECRVVISDKLESDGKMVRELVFVKEQGFKYEFDDIDSNAWHLLIYDGDKPIAAGRLYEDDKNEYHIGRIAVLPEYRGQHIGRLAVKKLEQKALECGGKAVSLSAQCRAEKFYLQLGYIPVGECYMDEFCPHIKMKKDLY